MFDRDSPVLRAEPGNSTQGRPVTLADLAAAAKRNWAALAPEPTTGAPNSGAPTAEAPTVVLPVITRRPPPAKSVAARAVIVYQERPRRPWLLWAFTLVLVALTGGVVLGQSVAFEPIYRSTANAQTPAPTAPTPSPSAPLSLSTSWPDVEHRATAPLGAIKAHILEVAGPSTTLRIRGADLGGTLLDVATSDRSAVPRLTGSKTASQLDLVPTGDPGTVGAEIQLNSKVAWTLRLTGGTAEQTVDLRAGQVTGIELAGGTETVTLQLPPPTGTVPLTVTGPVNRLILHTETGTAIRLRLKAGAQNVVLDGKSGQKVKAGAALSTTTWRTAENRYDLTASDPMTSIVTGP